MAGVMNPEKPNNSVTSIFESMLFDSEERDQDGQIIKAKLLPNYFKICLLEDDSTVTVQRVLSQYPSITFIGSRVEFRSIDDDKDSRMIYTDEFSVFSFICNHLSNIIQIVNAPLDGISVQEWHFLKQLENAGSFREISFFRRGTMDLESESADILTEEQIQLYSDLVLKSIKNGTLKILKNPDLCLQKCISELSTVKLDVFHIEFDEADFLMDLDDVKLKAGVFRLKSNYFKPSKLFSKIEADKLDLIIRFKFSKPREDVITPCESVKYLSCKINYIANLEEIFNYINEVFPSLETFEIETNWGITALCSFEVFNPAEKLSTRLKECLKVIGRIEAAGLRGKSNGLKAKIKLLVKILMPSEDTTFFSNKDIAKSLRKVIHESIDPEFCKIPEDDSEPEPIKKDNGVTRIRKLVDHFMILESNF